ncbi:MAG: hypothetical protein N2446_03220 [Elusimicrobiales bacterium]|nr:hypothetical protein [Elusimicrobiales bacterium]
MITLLFIIISLIHLQEPVYGPYILNATDNTITLKYALNKPIKSWLGWGIYPKCDTYLTFFGPQKNVVSTIYGLQSDKNYCYTLYLPVENSTFSYIFSSATFHTITNSTSLPFNFIVFTDLNGYASEICNSLDFIIDTRTQFAIYFGSITENSSNGIPSYFSNYSKFISKIPFYIPAIEHNFDYEKGLINKQFQNYFYFSYNGISPYYYYIDVGTVRLLLIDLIKSKMSKKFFLEQKKWLEKTLETTSKDWIIAVFNTDISVMDEETEKIIEILSNKGVDLIIHYGNSKYLRRKIFHNNNLEIISLSIGEKVLSDDVEYFEFKSDIDGIIKINIDYKKLEIFYLDFQFKEIDHLVYQK